MNGTNLPEKVPGDEQECPNSRLYKRRWVIVFTFALYLATNAYQWLSLVVIGDVIMNYYNESLPEDELKRDMAVDWLSLIYMLTYVVLIIPSMWLLQKKGLRVAGLCGAILNCIGAWIKVASVRPDRFAVLMVGQTVCSIAQVFTLSLPARIAAVWFGPNEVSTATAIGIFGIQVCFFFSCMYVCKLYVFDEKKALENMGKYSNINPLYNYTYMNLVK